jgi:hypothetical protein
MARDTGECDPPGVQMQKEQDVIRHEAAPGQNLDGKEICAGENRQMSGNEIFPCGGLAALRRRCDTLTTEDIADRLVGDAVVEVSQRADNPIVSPARVLLGHADDESFEGQHRRAGGQDTSGAWIRRTCGKSADGTKPGLCRV